MSPKIITEGAVSSVQIKGSQDQHTGGLINTVARLGSRSKPEGLGRYRVLRPAGQGILSQVEAESLTIAELIKVAETYALLAVAEALQFSLGQDWPAARC